MDIPTLRKIIELHLKGYRYSEISKRSGIARSTVQDAVNRWRSGQTSIFEESVGYVEDITDIAKDMRKYGLKIEDLKMPFLNASVLKGMGIDLQDLCNLYDIIRNYGPDILPEIIRTVIKLQSQGTDPSDMLKKLENLRTEIKDMEDMKRRLEDDVSSIDAKLKEENRVKGSLDAEISEMQETIRSLKEQEVEINDKIKKYRERIERSDRFWSAITDMAIDPNGIEEFMKNIKSLGYDAKKVPSMEEFEKYGIDRAMPSDEMRTLVLSLRQLNSAGWSPGNIVKLAMAMNNVSDDPATIIEHMQAYTDKYREVERAKKDLDKEPSEAYSDHKRKMDTLKMEYDELNKCIAEMRNERYSLQGEIEELNNKKEEAERAYENVIEESMRYGDSVKSIEGLQRIIDEYGEEKESLEISINAMKEKFNEMQISLEIAESIQSIILGRDMRIKELCEAFVSSQKNAAISEEDIRERIINDIIEISKGDIVPM